MKIEYLASRKKHVAGAKITDPIAESTPQAREDDPVDKASTNEIWRRIVENASAAERAKLHAMTPDQRLKLITEYADDPDRPYRRGRSR